MGISTSTKILRLCLILGILVFILGFVSMQIFEKINYKNSLVAKYYHSLNATQKYINDIEKILTKVRLSKISSEKAKLFAEAWKQSALARDAISSMPLNPENTTELMGYLNQVSDFSYAMMSKSAEGFELSIEEWKRTDEVREGCGMINFHLNNISVQKERFHSLCETGSANAFLGQLKTPSYDSMLFRNDTSEIEISVEEGLEITKYFLEGYNITDILYCGTTDREIVEGIPVFSYEIFIDGNEEPAIWMDVSRVGGYPVMMLSDIKNDDSGVFMTEEELIVLGEQFLQHAGFSGMKCIDYKMYGGFAIISFVQSVKDIIIYPEIVKLKVSLKDGAIVGFQGDKYLSARRERSFDKPKLSEEEALLLVSEQFNVREVALAVIESHDKQGEEVNCYRIDGYFGSEQFSIFINANDGHQEKIINLNNE